MNAKDCIPRLAALVLRGGVLPLLVLVALAGCQARQDENAADSLNVSVETPPPAATGPTRYMETNNNQEVAVAPGSEFEVALAEPSPGMAWVWVDSTTSPVVLVSRTSNAEDTVSGTGAVSVWRFRAPATGSTPIRLELREPGSTGAATQTYMLTVRAE
jgi:predicted secreted protein